MRLASKDTVLPWYHCREVPLIRCTATLPASPAAAGHPSLPLQDGRAPDDGHVLRFSDTCRVAVDARGTPVCASAVHRHSHQLCSLAFSTPTRLLPPLSLRSFSLKPCSIHLFSHRRYVRGNFWHEFCGLNPIFLCCRLCCKCFLARNKTHKMTKKI